MAPGIREAQQQQKKKPFDLSVFSVLFFQEFNAREPPTKEMACKQWSYFLLLSCRRPQKFPPRPLTEEVEGRGRRGGGTQAS